MAIQSRKNQYRGVNAHLHSLLQSSERVGADWRSFHSHLVPGVASVLNSILPPRYRAISEYSLQIVVGGERPRTRYPDVTVFEGRPGEGVTASRAVEASITLPLSDYLAVAEDELMAVVIYDQDVQTATSRYGIPVTRLEVLSPANKRGLVYRERRLEALHTGLPLVEIDLLHESPSPVVGMPPYPDAADSFPYTITISDPERDEIRIYGWHVDDPIPVVAVPLTAHDSVDLELSAAYERAFGDGRWGDDVDYAHPPLRMQTYSTDDQARIEARMATVAQAVQRGDDLEEGPFRQH